MTDHIEIIRPDDWHVHLRDGPMLRAVVAFTASTFGRAIVMPNLQPPITTVAAAEAYRDRILQQLPADTVFQPLMTCYLTDNLDAEEVRRGREQSVFAAAKLYPAGATFNSDAGVRSLTNVQPVLETMQAIGLPLLVHGEVVDPDIDIFDREAVFIERVLEPMRRDFPELRIVFEHVTTEDAVQYVLTQPSHVAATITPHHLLINRNAIFAGGVRPHMYCLPVAKRERHRLALVKAATSGDHRFFLGTDSAPHATHLKEAGCGCAGIFNAANAMACYAQVFDEEQSLDKLEAFASLNGPAFYGLPANTDTIRLQHIADETPQSIAAGSDNVLTFTPPRPLQWTVA